MVSYLELLRDNGRYVLCGSAGGPPTSDFFPALLDQYHKSPTLVSFSLNSVAADDRRPSWQEIMTLWTRGAISPVLDERLPLTEAEQALRLLERGTPFGKVVLLPR